MDIMAIQKELRSKERSIADLTRFVQTRNDENPNYSILLGAGCSVTSGVRSAHQLIEEWRREIYISLNTESQNSAGYDADKAKEYFTANHSSWYDRRNEYSSLFEKKFDLPRQRRMFIEQEVRDKKPSIGYAYLVNLVKNKYFRTLFTTNFDDLINESFYSFSSERPILCAHDSAISSITVTSSRPKIIKLHGDYLFDDLKSTVRETESLEENMRSKFIEFAKDYGLIILGYGGHDRSILDILYYLLKHEEYFKHGLYWCFRRSDNVNEEVRKLLWRDRVYYVQVEGFDEIMAELNASLCNREPPIKLNIITGKPNEQVTSFLDNPMLAKSPSRIIKDDLAVLKEQTQVGFLNMLLENLGSGVDDEETSEGGHRGMGIATDRKKNRKLLLEQKVAMLQLHETFSQNDFAGVLDKIQKLLTNGQPNSAFTEELISLQARAHAKLGNRKDALEAYTKLKTIDNHNPQYLLNVLMLTQNYEERIAFADELITLNEYYYLSYYHKARVLVSKYNSCIYADKKELEKIIVETLEMGILKDPSQRNPCWFLKFDFYLGEKHIREEALEECQKILDDLEKQNPYSWNFVNAKRRYMLAKNDKGDDILALIEEAIARPQNAEDGDWMEMLLKTLSKLNRKEQIRETFGRAEKKYQLNDDYFILKGELLLAKFRDLNGAIDALREALQMNWHQSTLRHLFKFLLYRSDFDEAEKMLRTQMGTDILEEEADFYQARKEYKRALEKTRSAKLVHRDSKSLIIAETFLLMHLGRNEESEKISKSALDQCGFNDVVLVINYELARKRMGKKPNKERLQRVRNLTNTEAEIAAIHALQDNSEKAYSHMSKQIDDDATYLYLARDWLVFEDLMQENKFRELLKNQIAG